MAILHDPYTNALVHDDQLPSPIVESDENGDYIIHRENGKTSYKAYEGGGSELPEVTADDNGDVLTVVSGEWAKATPSGGGGVLVVHEDDDTGALDKTWQEIYDALSTGIVIKSYVIPDIGAMNVMILSAYIEEGVYSVQDSNTTLYSTNSASGYPVNQDNGGGGSSY